VQGIGQWERRETFELYKFYDAPDLANVIQLTDEGGQNMSYKWIIIGQLRKCLTQHQNEKEELECLY
jgi:hypothetical protein